MSIAVQPSQLSLLRRDVLGALRGWRFWLHLGWSDVAHQYRRSFIGPVWITLSTAIFTIAFGLIGSQLFKTPIEDYLPYFCAGQIMFSYLSALMTEGCQTYIAAAPFLKQIPHPKTAFVLRVVWRNSIMMLHHLVVVFGVLFWAGRLADVHWVSFLLGLAITLLAACFVVAIVGALATRFRDIPMIVTSFMQICFFLTPVMWRPEQLTERAKWVVTLNPFASFLTLLRGPLLGEPVQAGAWLVAIGLIAVLSLTFLVLYRYARRRIVYWL